MGFFNTFSPIQMTRKPDHILQKQEEHYRRSQLLHEQQAERRQRIVTHTQDVFKNVLQAAGLQVLCGSSSMGGVIILDRQRQRFNLQTFVARHGKLDRVCVKVSKAGDVDRMFDKPFFSWCSLRGPRPRKAALLLAKKIELNMMYEVMET